MTSQLSFGKKIPLTQFQVLDKRTGEYLKSTLFELDCKDVNDMWKLDCCRGKLSFKDQIVTNMWRKQKDKSGVTYGDISFHTAETENGDIIGISQIYKGLYYKDVTYIASDREKPYKYCGQGMLASIGKILLHDIKLLNLMITTPLATAKGFYKDICGFEEIRIRKNDFYNSYLNMDRTKLREFIKNVEEKTATKIIDLTL